MTRIKYPRFTTASFVLVYHTTTKTKYEAILNKEIESSFSFFESLNMVGRSNFFNWIRDQEKQVISGL